MTKAIAVGHDLGHAPFGHGGERIINELAKKYGLESFWHEVISNCITYRFN